MHQIKSDQSERVTELQPAASTFPKERDGAFEQKTLEHGEIRNPSSSPNPSGIPHQPPFLP
jgi:hypothetical protein